MLAVVSHEAPFDHGREQMQQLAGLSVTTKAVEQTAEATEKTSRREAENIQWAMTLDWPAVGGSASPSSTCR
jgi:hypothetical protein